MLHVRVTFTCSEGSKILQRINLDQLPTTLNACSFVQLQKTEEAIVCFLIFFFFPGCCIIPLEQTCMWSLAEKSLSHDNPKYVDDTGRGAVLCKYCSHYHQWFAWILLHQNCFMKGGCRLPLKIIFWSLPVMGFLLASWSDIMEMVRQIKISCGQWTGSD